MKLAAIWKKSALWIGVILVATACSLPRPIAELDPASSLSLGNSPRDWPNPDWQRTTAEQ